MTDAALINQLQQIETTLQAAVEGPMSTAAGEIGKLISTGAYTAEEILKHLPKYLHDLVGPQVEKMSNEEIARNKFWGKS